MPKEPLQSPHGDPRREGEMTIGMQAIRAAKDIHRLAPDTKIYARGVFALTPDTAGNPRRTRFTMERIRNVDGRQIDSYQLQLPAKEAGPGGEPLPAVVYFLDQNGDIRINNFYIYVARIEAQLDRELGPRFLGEEPSEERVRRENLLFAEVDKLLDEEHVSIAHIIPREQVLAMLTQLQKDLGGSWQSTASLVGENHVDIFKKVLEDHATEEIRSETTWIDDGRPMTLTTQEGSRYPETVVTLKESDLLNLNKFVRLWEYTPTQESTNTSIEGAVLPVDQGLGLIQRRADTLTAMERALTPDTEANDEALRFVREIHGRDPNVRTIFRSAEIPIATLPGQPQSYIRFEREVDKVDGEPVVSHVFYVLDDVQGEPNPWVSFHQQPDGTYLQDFPILRVLAESILDTTENREAIENYKREVEAGEHILDEQDMRLKLLAYQTLARDAWPIPLRQGPHAPDFATQFRDIVDAGVTDAPHRTIQVSFWQMGDVQNDLVTFYDDHGNLVSTIFGEQQALEVPDIDVSERAVWKFTSEHAPGHKTAILVHSDVPLDHPQRGLLEELIATNAAAEVQKEVGPYRPASDDEKQKGLALMERSAAHFRMQAEQQAPAEEVEQGTEAAGVGKLDIAAMFYGPDAAVAESPEDRLAGHTQEANGDDQDEGGAWTTGSHRTGDQGRPSPNVEMRGNGGEVHDVTPDEGDEPEKGNGRE